MKSAKQVSVFKGIKGLIGSGNATTKTAKASNMTRPEGKVSIDAGAVKPRSGGVKVAAGSPKKVTGSGHKGIHIGLRPEGKVKKDSASVIKP